MENLTNHSWNSNGNLIISNIYLTEKEVEKDINKLQKEITFKTIPQILNLCEKIKEKILYCEDEQLLSKTQNGCRRINIAAKLVFDLYFLYENSLEFECNNIVCEMLNVQMLRKISNKIIRKNFFMLKLEKYFFQQAEIKLLKSVEGESSLDFDECSKNKNVEQSLEKNKNLETEVQPSLFHDTGNASQIRDVTHYSNFQTDTINPFQENGDTYIHLETSIKDLQSQLSEDMRQISDILEDRDATIPEMPEVPERSLEISGKASNLLQRDQDEIPNGEKGEDNLAKMKIMEDSWSLSHMEPVEPKLKKRRKPVTIDQHIVIPNYAARALQLNKNINIQRVQVYEGPPNLLKSISLSHVMKNPSFRASKPQERRNSKLNSLYHRHLLTEKKPFQSRQSTKRQFMEVRQAKEVLEPQMSFEEYLGVPMKTGHALHAREALTEISAERSLQEEYNRTAFASFDMDLERESLIGQPLSRIVQPVIPSPEAEHINTDVPLPNGRVQQLQGQNATSPISFWTYSPEKHPPNEKWREFNFVMKKLEDFWTSLEQTHQVKEINARNLLSCEEDNAASFLTLLRILDKLSLQRKLVLKTNKSDIFIRPFEKPYVSDKAFMLKDQEPKF